MADGTVKPTSSETSLDQRRLMVQLHQQGWTYPAIAHDLGVSRWTVRRWVQRYRQAGEVGLAYRPRRPRSEHPQTTPAAVRTRIRALREAHPGWGARLIRHQLEREGWTGIPSEVTIQAWLRRFGFELLQPRTSKPVGWTTPTPAPDEECWQADFKEKGGSPILVSSPAHARPSVWA